MSIRPVTEYPMLPQPGRATPAGLAQHQGFMVAALVRHFGELGFAINRLIKRTRFGKLADRPDAGEADRFYLATDQSPVELYYDDGSSWHLIASQVGKDIGDVPQYEDDGSGNPVLDHPNMPLVGGDPVVYSGTGTNGYWVRFSDGTQICHGQFQIATSRSAGVHQDDFTLPSTFDSASDMGVSASVYELTILGAEVFKTYETTPLDTSTVRVRWEHQHGSALNAFCTFNVSGRWK